MKITTKMGDKGETSLFGGRRVSKASAFIELVGELDELQAVVGWCGVVASLRSVSGEANVDKNLQINRSEVRDIPKVADENLSPVKLLEKITDDLYRMMSIVGFEMKCPGNIQPIGEEDVEFLEKEMSKYAEVVGDLTAFVRPEGSELAARLHIARTVCRRVERRMVGMMDRQSEGEAGEKMISGVMENGGEGMQHVPGNVFTNHANSDVTKFMLKYLNRLSDLLFVLAYGN